MYSYTTIGNDKDYFKENPVILQSNQTTMQSSTTRYHRVSQLVTMQVKIGQLSSAKVFRNLS